jgi:hypothetical protein
VSKYGRTAAIFCRFKDNPYNLIGVEIGVNTGMMSEDLLKGRERLILVMVDNWKAEENQPEHYKAVGDYHAHLTGAKQLARRAEALERTQPYESRRFVYHMDSDQAAEEFCDQFGEADFVFIDGWHSYEGVKQDIEAWYSLVKHGGYLCGHDYQHNLAFPKFNVKQAVDEAVDRHGWKLELDIDNTWFCQL